MARPGEAQRLGALAHADVEHSQPLADREPDGYLLVDLTGDKLLTHGVAQPAQALQPGGRRTIEALGLRAGQGRSPRLTCGFGSRIRRIWSVRIRP
ncbi:hypothetical protein GCM10009612_45000 [Streptomyces beijiangensis]